MKVKIFYFYTTGGTPEIWESVLNDFLATGVQVKLVTQSQSSSRNGDLNELIVSVWYEPLIKS